MFARALSVTTMLAVLGIAAVPAAEATMVTYSTQASFDGVNYFSSVSQHFDGSNQAKYVDVAFAGAGATVDASPVFSPADLGTITLTSHGDGATVNTPLYLRIVQTQPTGGDAFAVATLSGQIKNSAGGEIDFTTTSITIGTVVYALLNDPLTLNAPNRNGGVTTIWASITTPTELGTTVPEPTSPTVVPEPASLTLLGSGLFAAAGLARRRRRVR